MHLKLQSTGRHAGWPASSVLSTCRLNRTAVLPFVVLYSAILATAASADERSEVPTGTALLFSADELKELTFGLAEEYFKQFQHPETYVLYGAKLSTKDRWTTPKEIKARQPKPWGYGSRIADTALHCGHTLVALLDAHRAAPDIWLERKARILFSALKFIGGVCPVEGLVPRGPHPDDATAYYDDSSMDQHTTYIIALARYGDSKLASNEDRQWISQKLNAIGHRLEKHNFSIKAADGVTESHVGFSWKGFRSNHASILIPTVFALYKGTGNEHWLKLHDELLEDRDGLRWELLHAGDHVELNGHPIYANQNGFRLNAYLHFLDDSKKRTVISDLLAQSAQMQLDRDFPGPFYRRFHEDEEWKKLAERRNWGDTELRGAQKAWELFRPEMLDERGGLTALAHVRFPLGGYHLVLMSERPELIRRDLPTIWEMLTTVDLQKISAAETHYLFTAVALHAYAYYHRHPELFTTASELGPKLENTFNVGIGPTMDVTIRGDHAFAIGSRSLHVLDITNPGTPRRVGKLDGLGRVRQIVVDGNHAYIASREDGLFIVDVSNAEKPSLISRHDTIEFATGICKSGNVLFVACRSFGVELIDVSDPSHPKHLSIARTGEAQSVVEQNGFLYAGVWATSEVVTVDVRNPWQPQIVSRTPLDGFGDGVDVDGTWLYAATGHHSRKRPRAKPGDPGYGHGHGLEVLSLTDPVHPRLVSRVKFPPGYDIHNDMWSVTVANNHAFVADTHNGVFVLDVSVPASPRFKGHWVPPDVPSRKGGGKERGFIGGLVPCSDHVYVAGGQSDLHVLAASGIATAPATEATTPVTIEKTPPPDVKNGYRVYQPGGQVYGVDFLGDIAIAACGTDGVHVLKVFPEFERLSQRTTMGKATDVSVNGNRIFIAEGINGLGIYQLSAEGMLKEVGRYGVPDKTIRQVEIPGDGRYAVLQIGIHKIQIVDVSDASRPQRILEDQHPGLLYGDQIQRGLIDDRYTCAFWHVSGLHWYDLQADGGPRYTGDNFAGRIGSSNGLIAHRNSTLAITRGGYLLLNRDERRPLADVSLYKIDARRRHLGKPTISGNQLVTVNRQSGLVTIADIADQRQPKLIDQFTLPGNPSRPVIHEGVLVIPDGYHGLLAFDR